MHSIPDFEAGGITAFKRSQSAIPDLFPKVGIKPPPLEKNSEITRKTAWLISDTTPSNCFHQPIRCSKASFRDSPPSTWH
jgi:hypothetical protein